MRFLARGAIVCSTLVLLPAASAAAAPTVTEFPIAQQDTDPLGIAAVSNASVVFAEGQGSDFGVGTSSGTTAQGTGLSGPAAGAAVADGYEWLTEPGANKIARVQIIGNLAFLQQFSLPSGGSQPEGITAGPDGNVWFTEAGNPAAIGRITPSGTISQFSTNLTPSGQPTDITVGPDGNLWFTEAANPGRIGKITPAGTTTEFRSGLTNNSQPTGITAGPDGNVWFTEAANPGAIGKITPSGTITEYSSGLTANSDPTAITAGPGGDLWFTEAANPGAIGWITPSGAISQLATPTTNSEPAAITQASIDDLWFDEDGDHGRLGQVTLPPPTTATAAAFAVGDTSTILAGTVNPAGFPATYHFEWGTSSAYGTSLPSSDASAGAGSTQNTVTQTLSGLSPGTTYHYRVVATNCAGCAAGTADGPDMTFTTASPPPATTTSTTATTPATATTPTNATATTPATTPTTTTQPAPAVAPPVVGKTAVAAVTSGTVLVKVPGSSQLQPLAADQNIPIGSLIDASNGHIDVTTQISAGRTQSAAVWGGRFVLGQTRARGLTTFRLADPELNCSAQADDRAGALTADAAAAAAPHKKRKPSLWAADDNGRYSTRGQNSVATVRGTEWETVDSCRGTLTHVKKGLVSVLDLHTHQAVLVHAGHSFLARP